MAHCYFKTVLVIGFRRVLGSGRQAQIRESRGRQTSLPGCWPNDIAHILPPTSLIKFLDVTSGEAFIRGANVLIVGGRRMCLAKNKHLLSRLEGNWEPCGGERGPGRDVTERASFT